MYRRGFTFGEVLIAVFITLILAALLYPVFTASVRKAKATSCQEKLRQLHKAIELYRSDSGTAASYDLPDRMGLPPNLLVLRQSMELPRSLLHCEGTSTRSAGAAFVNLFMVPRALESSWLSYVTQMRDNTVILLDDNHNANTRAQGVPFATQHAFGVTLGGTIRKKTSKGNPASYEFWTENE